MNVVRTVPTETISEIASWPPPASAAGRLGSSLGPLQDHCLLGTGLLGALHGRPERLVGRSS